MGKLITASIDLTKIDKSKIVEGKKGGKYINLTIWENDQPDQFGNDFSIQQSLSKEEREAGAAKIYLGNGKYPGGRQSQDYRPSNDAAVAGAVKDNQTNGVDLPF